VGTFDSLDVEVSGKIFPFPQIPDSIDWPQAEQPFALKLGSGRTLAIHVCFA
jgi:hypothetical protein